MEKNPLLPVRNKIDEIDKQLLPLFIERMHCSEEVARIKQQEGLPILNPKREAEILASLRYSSEEYGEYAEALYKKIFALSRERQHRMLDTGSTSLQTALECHLAAEVIRIRFDIQNAPGALCAVLERFALRNLNITQIKSQPVANDPSFLRIYLAFSGNLYDADTAQLTSSLSCELSNYTFLEDDTDE